MAPNLKPSRIAFYLPFAMLLLLTACGGKKADEAQTPATAEKKVSEVKEILSIGRVEPELKVYKLSPEVSGVIQRVVHFSGDQVRQGEVIIELVHDLEEAAVAQAAASIQSRKQDLVAQQASIDAQRIVNDNSRKKANRLKALVETGAEISQNYDNAETDAKNGEAVLRNLNARLETTRLQLGEDEIRLRTAKLQFEKRFLRAPTNGRILAMDMTPGMALEPKVSYADFAPEGYISVLTEVDELFANQVKIGDPVKVRLLGMTEILATGSVIYTADFLKKKSLFSETATDKEDRRVREVRVRLTDAGKLLIGNRVECLLTLKPTTASK